MSNGAALMRDKHSPPRPNRNLDDICRHGYLRIRRR